MASEQSDLEQMREMYGRHRRDPLLRRMDVLSEHLAGSTMTLREMVALFDDGTSRSSVKHAVDCLVSIGHVVMVEPAASTGRGRPAHRYTRCMVGDEA